MDRSEQVFLMDLPVSPGPVFAESPEPTPYGEAAPGVQQRPMRAGAAT